MEQQLILASSSKQRLILLKKINIVPTKVISININETMLPKERAFALVKRISLNKLSVAQVTYTNHFIISAYTVVSRGNLLLGKPKNINEAELFLKMLTGRRHKVITGISVCNSYGSTSSKVVSTSISFKKLSNAEIQNYLTTREWCNKVGGYTINGYAEIFVKQIIGSYSNILGLPTLTVCNILKGLGYTHKWPQVIY